MDKNKKLFPQRLWELIHDDKYSFCLRWSQDGQRVYLNRNEFETHYLKTGSNQFHTQKAISFVRQMNMYGFRKVDDCFYENDNFKRNCPHLLKNMIRKHSNRAYFSSPPSSVGPASSTHQHQQHHPPYAAGQLQAQPQGPQPQVAPLGPLPLPGALPVFAHQPGQASSLAAISGPQTVQQQATSKQQIPQLTQAELKRLHQHLQQQHLAQDSTLVTSLQHQHQHQRTHHDTSTPPDTGSSPASVADQCLQAAEVARSLSNLGAAMAAHTHPSLASSLYYRLAAGLNLNSLNQQQHQQPTSASGQQQQQVPSAAEQQLISQLLQARNHNQLAPAPTTTTTTNNPNSLLARPTSNTCLEQQQHLNQSSQQLLQHCHQQQQQQQQQRQQLAIANRQQQPANNNNNQLNFLDSTSGTIGGVAGLSAAEQVALQENLVRTFLQLHSRQQLHHQPTTAPTPTTTTTTTTTIHNIHNQLPTNQLHNKPLLLRTLHEQNLLQSLATLTSGQEPRPPPQPNSPLELVVKKR